MSSSPKPIATDRLVLRPFVRTDREALGSYQMLREMQRYLEWPVRDAGDIAAGLDIMCRQVSLQRPGDVLSFAVVRKSDQHLIGQISLRWADATAAQAEFRLCIAPRHVGHGFAREAVTAILDHAFDIYKMHRVFARCEGRNHRAAKLLQRLGMRLEAHYREHALFQGEWDEELHFAILDREWRRSHKVRELRPPAQVA